MAKLFFVCFRHFPVHKEMRLFVEDDYLDFWGFVRFLFHGFQVLNC